MGYFRPVDQWNKGKQSEYEERRAYQIPETTVAVRSAVAQLVVPVS